MIPAIGLDLSTTATGIALIDGTTRLIRPKTDSSDPSRRLHELIERISSRLSAGQPQVVVIEGYGYASQRLARNAELGGAVRLRLFEMDIPYVEIAPTSLKKFATGDGGKSTDKAAMVAAAQSFGADVHEHNQADAWLLWLAAQQRYEPHLDRPMLTDTLLSLPWPELGKRAA